MPKKTFTKKSELADHVAKNPKLVHGIWEKVLTHGPRIYVSDDAPLASDGVDGDVWLEY